MRLASDGVLLHPYPWIGPSVCGRMRKIIYRSLLEMPKTTTVIRIYFMNKIYRYFSYFTSLTNYTEFPIILHCPLTISPCLVSHASETPHGQKPLAVVVHQPLSGTPLHPLPGQSLHAATPAMKKDEFRVQEYSHRPGLLHTKDKLTQCSPRKSINVCLSWEHMLTILFFFWKRR